MIGLGRMALIGTSFLLTLACQGCVQTGTSYTAPSTPPQTYETRTAQPDYILAGPTAPQNAKPSINYEGTFRRFEDAPRLAFKAPENFSGPINLQVGHTPPTTRLYASDALTNFASDRTIERNSPVPRNRRNLNAEIQLSAPSESTGLAFDVGVAPRLSVTRDGAFETRRFGGELRIGQNFDKRGEMTEDGSWYLFAGADGEALVWEPDETGRVSVSDMALRDQVTVGDMQAGVSLQRGGGQLSLSYIRREVEYRERNLGASENEDFAGLSFTIKR